MIVENNHHVVEVIEEVFDFTLLTSILNFWYGDAIMLAILTAVFCACWPYARAFSSLVPVVCACSRGELRCLLVLCVCYMQMCESNVAYMCIL